MKRRVWFDGVGEAAAMLRQTSYILQDLRRPLAGGREVRVVLLHGLYAAAGVFRPLRERIERELGLGTASFSYAVGPGILALSGRTTRFVEELTPRRSVFLVGHSVGGLVACHAAYFGGLRGRVAGTISLASPFLGSRRSWLAPGPIGRDISVGTPLLSELKRGPVGAEGIRHVSVIAREDALIEGEAFPDFGERLALEGIGHNQILFDQRAQDLVIERLRLWVEDSESPNSPCLETATP